MLRADSLGMNVCKLSVALLVMAAASNVGCAPPSPGEAVDESSGAVSGPGEPGATPSPVLMSGLSFARFVPADGTVEEKVVFDQPRHAARVCYAYLDGTDAQRRACDDYPTNYTDMSCVDGPSTFPHLLFNVPQGPISECVGRRPLGVAPLDQGDGQYQAHFVSVKDPSKRLSVVPEGIFNDPNIRRPEVFSDFFQLYLDDTDVRQENGIVFDRDTFVRADREGPSRYFGFKRVRKGPHITVELRRDLVGQVRGCASGFSKRGLSDAEIGAKTAELRAECANPQIQVDGREGWQTLLGTPNAERAQLKFDASPLLGPEQVMILAFEVEGRVRQYQFELNCIATDNALCR